LLWRLSVSHLLFAPQKVTEKEKIFFFVHFFLIKNEPKNQDRTMLQRSLPKFQNGGFDKLNHRTNLNDRTLSLSKGANIPAFTLALSSQYGHCPRTFIPPRRISK